MKRTIISIVSSILAVSLVFSLAACSGNIETPEVSGIWEKATHPEDKEFGNGAKTVQVEVKAEDKSVTFTIHTDKEILGDVLLEHKLIEGENGAYGMYIKTVNGILADYDIDQSYWAVSKNGEAAATGVDGIKILDGDHYELVYTKM